MRPPVFLLHPGLGTAGVPTPYWELCDPEEGIVQRLEAGEIPRAGIVLAVPALPAAWMRGRFLASLGGTWKEILDQVEINLEAGLEACPTFLRERYRAIATGRPIPS